MLRRVCFDCKSRPPSSLDLFCRTCGKQLKRIPILRSELYHTKIVPIPSEWHWVYSEAHRLTCEKPEWAMGLCFVGVPPESKYYGQPEYIRVFKNEKIVATIGVKDCTDVYVVLGFDQPEFLLGEEEFNKRYIIKEET